MLIRSQSGNSLINLNHSVGIGITEAFDGVLIMCQSTTDDYKLGKYSSMEKAIKVIDEIERCYVELPPNSIYYMPADDEVEV